MWSAISTFDCTGRTQRTPFHLTVTLVGLPSMCCGKRHLTQPNLGRRTRFLASSISKVAGSDSVKLMFAFDFFLNCGG